MSESYDIFISYSSKDSNIVHKYAEYLESLGYTVWYDVKGLYTGVEFSEKIVSAIENSQLFIYFSSKNANESEWTKGEILTAQKYKKQILPVRIDDADYDKSIMLVLLPLQYIVCKDFGSLESLEMLRDGVAKYIKPTCAIGKEYKASSNIRTMAKQSVVISVITSFLMSLLMMVCSGEYYLNMSLSLFAMLITTVFCILASLYLIYIDKDWNRRTFEINVIYLLGTIFFLSYSFMAFGLCFVSIDVFLLNFPSIICAIFSIYSLKKLMAFRKIGYKLLWICAALFSIGSYWWLMESITASFIVAFAGCGCMAFLTYVLKDKSKGVSMWERLF